MGCYILFFIEIYENNDIWEHILVDFTCFNLALKTRRIKVKACSGVWIIDGRAKAQDDKTCIRSKGIDLTRGSELEIYKKKS
jgi:hypothetical protein